ncbi:glutamate--tRNA ligase [Candidatus Karelsulcia muelleri]|uniref:Glutamate--tRNA ligase n=1 Tax=Candidatus Karelsulcia muelleri PSPU TaxID=1189303 RepID=A0AAD1AY77_9FLAO|nr:glutamate--tRNA ligase [Candidatus Karelsulcia muelleri]NJJ98815.1 glutamate--tRNA ligase [Candidatus Karelsulcia muelleri]BAO66215.1 glutamyl-tRNA synthetase [Candidatus Karelsulcia muelleri PSPU]
MKKIRVRFAPSPTGPLHIGSIRTALYNYLFAKKNNGKFLLRIEDTDQSRLMFGAENYIIESLKWCGIKTDEGPTIKGYYGPYSQSERNKIYKKYIKYLLNNNFAYYAFDKKKKLEKLRNDYKKNGDFFLYNYSNRKKLDNSLNLSNEETFYKINKGIPYVIRYKIPKYSNIEILDLIRGKIYINYKSLDDKILFKSDETPTYHLANVIDDHLMNISHVIKGEEWLPSMPINLLLYKSFDWDPPYFLHLPLILNPIGKGKISKRNINKYIFPIFPLKWKKTKGYRELGYSYEAFINMLVLLGWNPGGSKEIFSLKELISIFDLKKINKSSAKFNYKKTNWFNNKYLQLKSSKDIFFFFKKELKKRNIIYIKNNLIYLILNIFRKKFSFLHEIVDNTIFFFKKKIKYDLFCITKIHTNNSIKHLHQIKNLLLYVKKFDFLNIKKKINKCIFYKNINKNYILQLLRLSMVGSLKGLDIFLIISIIGKKESIKRIIKIFNIFII